jgi:hypothetical protein
MVTLNAPFQARVPDANPYGILVRISLKRHLGMPKAVPDLSPPNVSGERH